MLGPEAIVSGALDTNRPLLEQLFPRLGRIVLAFSAFFLGLTIVSIINYARIVMDPDGEIIVT